MKKQTLNFETARQIIRCIILTSKNENLWFNIVTNGKVTLISVNDDEINIPIETLKVTKQTANKLKQKFPQYIF